MNAQTANHAPRGRQLGLTLVELMVALAISLALVVAASMLFLNTRFSQRASDEHGQMQETAQLALQLLGSQIASAGFYPMNNEEQGSATGANTGGALVSYDGAIKVVAEGAGVGTLPITMASGMFGCDDGVVKTDLSGCVDNGKANAPGSDSLSVAYFTSDAMSLDMGTRGDCTYADVANDSTYNNAGRVGSYIQETTNKDQTTTRKTVSRGDSNLGLPPEQPLLGVNRYFLKVIEKYVDATGNPKDIFALACSGNGGGLGTGIVLVPGVVQMTFRYGVATDSTGAPTQYIKASEVSTLNTDVVVGNQTMKAWSSVVAVRVCVMVRSLNPGAAKLTAGAVKDCNGDDYAGGEKGVAYLTLTQTFSVKSRLQQSVNL
jgi:type IV pilus assembly protein PilW